MNYTLQMQQTQPLEKLHQTSCMTRKKERSIYDMLKHKDHFHGSDLEKIEDIYGIKKEGKFQVDLHWQKNW